MGTHNVCQGCKRSVAVAERVEHDKKKAWLITFCPKCNFNFDIEEIQGDTAKGKASWFKSRLFREVDKGQ